MKKTLLILTLVVFVAACSGQNATPLPTPTQIPTFAYLTPTPFAAIATAVATEVNNQTESAAIDPTAVARGASRYTALTCDQCHGDKGQGNGDKGPALVPETLSENDFITFLRTGGKMGSAHLYASNRLSDEGAHNLYVYLKSVTS